MPVEAQAADCPVLRHGIDELCASNIVIVFQRLGDEQPHDCGTVRWCPGLSLLGKHVGNTATALTRIHAGNDTRIAQPAMFKAGCLVAPLRRQASGLERSHGEGAIRGVGEYFPKLVALRTKISRGLPILAVNNCPASHCAFVRAQPIQCEQRLAVHAAQASVPKPFIQDQQANSSEFFGRLVKQCVMRRQHHLRRIKLSLLRLIAT